MKKVEQEKVKKELWAVWHKAKELEASRKVTDAIIDVMVLLDKEHKNSEKIEVCS